MATRPNPYAVGQDNVLIKKQTESGTTHSFTQEERRSFSEHLNQAFANDPNLRGLPMNPHSNDLFTVVGDGVLLCKMLNKIKPGIIPENKINTKPTKSPFEKTANHVLALDAAKQLGISTVNIGPQDLINGTPHLVLGVLWQAIRMDLLNQVSLEKHPEMVVLLNPKEDLKSFAFLPPEQTLLRWFNYHLKRAGSPRQVTNFSGDIRDSECYTVLLNQLAPQLCSTHALRETDLTRRANMMLENADKLGCKKFVAAEDVVNGNAKLNLAFVAYLFNQHPGLEIREQEDMEMKRKREEEVQQVLALKLKAEEDARRAQMSADLALQNAEKARRDAEARTMALAAEEESRRSALAAEEAARRRRLEEEEAARRAAWEAEEARRRAELEELDRRKRMLDEENARRMAAERAAFEQAHAEEAARRRAQLEAEENARRQRLAQEEAARKAAWDAEEAGRRAAADAEARRLAQVRAEEEARRQAQLRAEEEARRMAALRAEEEARRQAQMRAEEEARRLEMERKRQADEYAAWQAQQAALLAQQQQDMYFQQQQAMMAQQYAMAMQQQMTQPTMYYQPQQSYTVLPGATTVYTVGTFPIPRLFVSVLEGRQLVKKDFMGLGKSDPYAVVECKGRRFQTIYQKNTQFPVWGETFEFNNILQTDTIHIAIFDYDVVGKHDFMGEVYLKAADFCNGQKWYMLSPRPGHRDRVAGEILVKIQIY